MTELGDIPVHWEVCQLGELGEFKNGINKSKEDFGFGIPFVNIEDIYKRNIIDTNDLGLINANEKEEEIYRLEDGDIVLVRSSVKPEGVGYPALYLKNDIPTLFCGFIIRYRYNKNLFDPLYMLYVLKAPITRRQVLSRSTVSANTNINQENLVKIQIPVPPLVEQRKIANILSTVDEQIDNVDQLIEKTKELKKGLMQQLLTKGIGHTEFKETEVGVIPKAWGVKKFKDICTINQGLQIAIENRYKEYGEGRLPYITIQYLNDKNNIENTFYIQDANESVICYEKDILVTRTGNTGIIVTDEIGVFHNNFVKVNYNNKIINQRFLYYYLNSVEIQKMIMKYAGTTTIPDLKHADFYRLPVVLPRIDEQVRISNTLIEADETIRNRIDKRTKLLEIKKGLMQQLLTGKIRVKTDK